MIIVWACGCHVGGVAISSDSGNAMQSLENQVGEHLRKRGNEGHAVRYGTLEGTVRVSRMAPPLEWEREPSG